jgi:hypothetical protein
LKVQHKPGDKAAIVPFFSLLPKNAPDTYFTKEITEYNARMGTNIYIKKGMLRIATIFPILFDPLLTKITDHISTLLHSPELNNVNYLFLVGGFAESSLLQARIRGALGEKVKVIIPPRPGTSVMNGAVLFGINPGNY